MQMKKLRTVSSLQNYYIDWIKVLRPTQHKIGHFADVLPANLLAQYWKTKSNTTKANMHQ